MSSISSGLSLKKRKRGWRAEILAIAANVRELCQTRTMRQRSVQISRLAQPVDLFFDKVMVMVDDEACAPIVWRCCAIC